MQSIISQGKFNKGQKAVYINLFWSLFKSTRCNEKREILKNTLRKTIFREPPQILFHRVNDYYDVHPVKFAKRPLFHRVNLKYARLAETGISREAETWHTKVKSTKYPNYNFVRMNLEDREQLNLLFELNKARIANPRQQRGHWEIIQK